MQDLTGLNKAVKKTLQDFGIKEPALVVAFTEANGGHKEVFWVSNLSKTDSIRVLEALVTKMRLNLN